MIYRGTRGMRGRGDALSLFEKSSAKAFLPGCSPTKLFLKLYISNRATTQQGSFLPSFFSKKRKSRPRVPASPASPDKLKLINYTEIGIFKYRGVLIGIYGYDRTRALHANYVVHSARYAYSHVHGWACHLARKSDLHIV